MPNVGKSSLFNALAGRTAAITSHEPGTTRDYLTATIQADGLVVELVDTAGAFDDDELDKLRTVGDALEIVRQKISPS